jgi:hypothetical protein
VCCALAVFAQILECGVLIRHMMIATIRIYFDFVKDLVGVFVQFVDVS